MNFTKAKEIQYRGYELFIPSFGTFVSVYRDGYQVARYDVVLPEKYRYMSNVVKRVQMQKKRGTYFAKRRIDSAIEWGVAL